MGLTETALIAEGCGQRLRSADEESPTHLVEAAADVVGRAVLLAARNRDVGGDVPALDEDPGDGPARPAVVFKFIVPSEKTELPLQAGTALQGDESPGPCPRTP